MTEQSYFKDAHGKYTFPGQRECDHCENADQFDCFTPVREYTIIFDDKHNGYPTAYVRYCLQCASLATANHPANISSIEPSRVVGLEVDGWRLWDDGQIEVSGLEGWEAPFGADPVPLEILELAEEANLELWGLELDVERNDPPCLRGFTVSESFAWLHISGNVKRTATPTGEGMMDGWLRPPHQWQSRLGRPKVCQRLHSQ